MKYNFTVLRLATAVLALVFFGIISCIAAFYPFSGVTPRAVGVMHSIIDIIFTSWLGDKNTLLVLIALTIILPMLCALGIIKSYPERRMLKAIAANEVHHARHAKTVKSGKLFG